MGCSNLCKKKIQKIDDIENKVNNSKDDIIILHIDNKELFNDLLKKSKEKAGISEEDDKILDDWRNFYFVFGDNFIKKFKEFRFIYGNIFKFSFELKTTFYTLSFQEVKDIIEELKIKAHPPIISEKLYSFLVENKNKIFDAFNNSKNVYRTIYDLFIDENDFQKEIIISTLKLVILHNKFNDNDITCDLIKLFQDIGFCIRILYYSLKNKLCHDIFAFEYEFDIRILYYLNLLENLRYKKDFPSDLFKLATESSRIKDTIILGEKEFREHIKSLNLPNERINDLDDDKLESFFQTPFRCNNKYKVVKYFVICEDINFETKYLEEFKNLSSKYGFVYLFLVYIKNKELIDIMDNLSDQKSVIYFCDDIELNEIYKDNNERLRPRIREFIKENYNLFHITKIQFEEECIYGDIEKFKSNSEDGWDLFEYKKDSFNFKFVSKSGSFRDFTKHLIGNLIHAYQEHNSLEIFFKYYSNYLFINLQPEFMVNMTAFVKMFLYAYSLEEKDPNKNFYCIVNDDLRSSKPEKIYRYLELIKVIGALIKTNKLKSYNGNVYRASFLKEELIQKIKIGDIIINSAFWSSSKKESVGKKFLKNKYKNALVIAKGEEINNVDIHLEKISRYPNEEEVLFLPFCNFKVISFEKINEGNLSYHKLVLESVSQTSLVKPYDKRDILRLNCENIEEEDDDDDPNVIKIKFNCY